MGESMGNDKRKDDREVAGWVGAFVVLAGLVASAPAIMREPGLTFGSRVLGVVSLAILAMLILALARTADTAQRRVHVVGLYLVAVLAISAWLIVPWWLHVAIGAGAVLWILAWILALFWKALY